MRLDVAFTPALPPAPERTVCVVIDVLRATSSLAVMCARGLAQAAVAETVEEARRLAAARPGALLCGEEGGFPPEGFDYGNSPAEFNELDLRGRRAVVATTNGTRALATMAGCSTVLVGALLNAGAAGRAALRAAETFESDLALVCAGDGRGRAFSLEDAFCAGALADLLRREGAGLELSSGATAALRLYRSYRGSAGAAFRESDHAARLAAQGLAHDVAFCAERDRFDVVPALVRGGDGTLCVVPG